jgi:hypothetical protein
VPLLLRELGSQDQSWNRMEPPHSCLSIAEAAPASSCNSSSCKEDTLPLPWAVDLPQPCPPHLPPGLSMHPCSSGLSMDALPLKFPTLCGFCWPPVPWAQLQHTIHFAELGSPSFPPALSTLKTTHCAQVSPNTWKVLNKRLLPQAWSSCGLNGGGHCVVLIPPVLSACCSEPLQPCLLQ